MQDGKLQLVEKSIDTIERISQGSAVGWIVAILVAVFGILAMCTLLVAMLKK
jgi:hypothetical protein